MQVESKGITYIFTRGMCSEVRLPLAAFAGGACANCHGVGWADTRRGREAGASLDCFPCHGTGTTTGIAGELMREHPITKVVLSDREPMEGRAGWEWPGIPKSIFDALAAPEFPNRPRLYFSRQAALAALSAALVALGKSRAFPVAVQAER